MALTCRRYNTNLHLLHMRYETSAHRTGPRDKFLTASPSTPPPYDPQTRALVQTWICSEESATLEAKMAACFCVFTWAFI